MFTVKHNNIAGMAQIYGKKRQVRNFVSSYLYITYLLFLQLLQEHVKYLHVISLLILRINSIDQNLQLQRKLTSVWEWSYK
jgi:hypothetical protein